MRKALLGIGAILFVALGVGLLLFCFHRYYYPNGFRSGKLTTFMGALTEYAMDHGGKYPDGGITPIQSLQKLYPRYASSALAGMSGDEGRTEAYLRKGKQLDTNVSSWVYFPGFSTSDNPAIAIIWEREAGIFVNGSRASGHAVGFVGGGYGQVSVAEWSTFVQEQQSLRSTALAGKRSERERLKP